MRYIMLLVILLIQNASFAQKSNVVIFIEHTTLGGLRTNRNFIGTSKKRILEEEDNLKLKNRLVDEYIISNKSIEKLQQFITERCNSKNSVTTKTTDAVAINMFSNQKSQKCFLIDKVQIKPYFIELKKTVAKLSRKEDVIQINKLIDSILVVLEYDFSKVKHE